MQYSFFSEHLSVLSVVNRFFRLASHVLSPKLKNLFTTEITENTEKKECQEFGEKQSYFFTLAPDSRFSVTSVSSVVNPFFRLASRVLSLKLKNLFTTEITARHSRNQTDLEKLRKPQTFWPLVAQRVSFWLQQRRATHFGPWPFGSLLGVVRPRALT